jgi:hypothetical protein
MMVPNTEGKMSAITKSGMLKFVDYAIAKGLVKSSTGAGWRAACNKILEDFGSDDDLADIDVPSEVLRYNNRHPGVLSPDSLSQYQNRVLNVMAEFGKYSANPTTYKGVAARQASNGKPTERKRQVDAKPTAEAPVPMSEPATHQKHITTSAVTETSLMLPFPLRPNFLAQIMIPRDLTKDEATRLCTFIQALAHEPAPAP